jgi:hypothetical protein
VNTALTGIDALYTGLSAVQKAKLKVQIADSVASITTSGVLSGLSTKSYVKSIEATGATIAQLQSPVIGGINIGTDKRITKISTGIIDDLGTAGGTPAQLNDYLNIKNQAKFGKVSYNP